MTQLALPHTIDAGTEITAVEHQANYTAIRDIINGQLEGGSGSDGNFKANGITARELADLILTKGLPSGQVRQEGIYNYTDLKVTPGAGLVLNYASGSAFVQDDSGVLAAGALLPATITGASVTVAANASGNPRIDQIILTITGYGTGTVSVLQGTATAGATLDNRNGAAALPSDAIRLADILMANGFAGPFVDITSIRDRRPWARPMRIDVSAVTSVDLTVDPTVDKLMNLDFELVTSAFVTVAVFPDNITTAIYSYAGGGASTQSTPAFTTLGPTGGVNSASGMVLATPMAPVAAGGSRYVGAATFGAELQSAMHLLNVGWAESSIGGSGSNLVQEVHSASIMSSAAGFGLLRLAVASGTFTGTIFAERV